jgi:bifunctional UDP-N-acetylglucosamine pyrophosphorylase / glucosamine-1-phosphate N-acetyltransferase
MPEKNIEVCILAAGMGTRMRSSRPKVMQKLAGRPLLAHLLDTVDLLKPSRIHIVVGEGSDLVQAAFPGAGNVNWVMQAERLGTGHAVLQAAEHFSPDSHMVILLGDAPLLSIGTLTGLTQLDCDLGVLTVDMDDPRNYGRIIRDSDGNLTAIVEERDATDDQKLVREINTGAMVAKVSLLRQWLSRLNNNNDQQEYLMTDIIEIASSSGSKVSAFKTPEVMEVTGINTFEQLASLEKEHQIQNARDLMARGVQIVDPTRFDLRGKVNVGKDIAIDINVILEGNVDLGDGVSIGANCIIKDSRIGKNSVIKPNSVIDDAVVESDCSVGPFARLRPGTRLKNSVAVGNFVEVKKSTLGEGSKASHLAYLGDSTIGASVNIGAGTITCNYDGVDKWQTHIKDNVFVGSNSSLVAPVTIGEGSTIGAGSTITRDVESDVLAIGRGRQKIITNWQKPVKKGR